MTANVARSREMRHRVLALGAALLLLAVKVHAHSADVIYLQVQWGANPGELTERITMTVGTLLLLIPSSSAALRQPTQTALDEQRAAIEAGVWNDMPLRADGQACSREGTRVFPREGYVELLADFRCGSGVLAQEFKVLSLLPAGYQVVVENLRANPPQQFADADVHTVFISGSRQAHIVGLVGWLRLGVYHIFSGLDHLAFLTALLIVGGNWRRVLVMVTSFTVAHSITLGATALNFIVLDARHQRWAEAAIALSVAYVAIENLLFKEHKYRPVITFGFGLIHGFGFAAALKEYGLGESAVTGLLGFNLGVEVGQACVVLVLYPVMKLLQRRPAMRTAAVRAASVIILLAGGYWFIDRLT